MLGLEPSGRDLALPDGARPGGGGKGSTVDTVSAREGDHRWLEAGRGGKGQHRQHRGGKGDPQLGRDDRREGILS